MSEKLEPVAPANDRQIELMMDFWRPYGKPPHVVKLNATLLKRDFLSLMNRLSSATSALKAKDARIAELEANVKHAEECWNHWLDEATYDVGGAPQLWSARATAAEAEAARLRGLLEEAMRAMDRCEHDGGFDREMGPIGCFLGDKCVCIGVYPILARSIHSRIKEKGNE